MRRGARALRWLLTVGLLSAVVGFATNGDEYWRVVWFWLWCWLVGVVVAGLGGWLAFEREHWWVGVGLLAAGALLGGFGFWSVLMTVLAGSG
jgi:hypothetical protein